MIRTLTVQKSKEDVRQQTSRRLSRVCNQPDFSAALRCLGQRPRDNPRRANRMTSPVDVSLGLLKHQQACVCHAPPLFIVRFVWHISHALGSGRRQLWKVGRRFRLNLALGLSSRRLIISIAIKAPLSSSVILLFPRVIQKEAPDELSRNIGDGWPRQIDIGIAPGIRSDSAERILIAPVDASEYQFPSIDDRKLFMKATLDFVSEALDELRKRTAFMQVG